MIQENQLLDTFRKRLKDEFKSDLCLLGMLVIGIIGFLIVSPFLFLYDQFSTPHAPKALSI